MYNPLDNTPIEDYLAAVEQSVGFPYTCVKVSVVEECFLAGIAPHACAEILVERANETR